LLGASHTALTISETSYLLRLQATTTHDEQSHRIVKFRIASLALPGLHFARSMPMAAT